MAKESMWSNKKYAKAILPILILGVFYMFFYSGLQNDHINILQPILMEKGWTPNEITGPIGVGGYLAIVMYFLCGWGMVKFGPTMFTMWCFIVVAICSAGIGISANIDAKGVYAVCLCVLRAVITGVQMGGFMLASNWFIKYRGRALGWITIGSPFFSVCGIALFTATSRSFGVIGTYVAIAAVLLIMGILTKTIITDYPEDKGLYADGLLTPTHDEAETEDISFKEVFTNKGTYMLIISYGLMTFAINCCMAMMMTRYQFVFQPEVMAPFDPKVAPVFGALAIGAALGIPMSYVLGWIDDKLGTPKASIVLNLLFFICVIPLMVVKPDSGTGILYVWAFGVACITGGVPTMDPASTAYVFGRKKYQAANKWVMTIKGVIAAFSIPYMLIFVNKAVAAGAAAGGPPDYTAMTPAYVGLCIMLVISLISCCFLFTVKDANLADREYGQKA
jgi:MFS family permease